MWTCPDGHQNSLKGFHDIEDGGVISNRVYCHEEDCGFVEYAVLDAWMTESTPS